MTGAEPVLIGVGQGTWREADPATTPEPVEMMAETARRAAIDSGAGERILARADTVAVVNVIGWAYRNAPRLLAERLGAHPAREWYTTIGGNTPQWLVNELAAKIVAGEVRLALLSGAEAVYTLRRALRDAVPLPWTRGGAGDPVIVGDPRPGTSEHEEAQGFRLPVEIYPLFENAIRARRRERLAAHRARLGALCSRLAAVAAGNPYAWFRTARSAEEIATVTAENRMVGFPYTKYMNAIMDVNQSASVLLASAAFARELGIDPSRWVYLRGCGDAHERWFVSERADYHGAPGLGAAGAAALSMAGVGIGEIDAFDLYSCFPSAVQMACEALGIPEGDPRPLTVTGGLPYHGGPGNNYGMHAIASLAAWLRARPGRLGLVTGVGWYMTKHAVGIYGTEPPARPWARVPAPSGAAADPRRPPALAIEASGRASIETYTVMHDRDGAPERGLVIGRLDDGRRVLASVAGDRACLEDLEGREGVGRTGRVVARDGVNRFTLD